MEHTWSDIFLAIMAGIGCLVSGITLFCIIRLIFIALWDWFIEQIPCPNCRIMRNIDKAWPPFTDEELKEKGLEKYGDFRRLSS